MINLLPIDEKKQVAREYYMRLASVIFVLLTIASLVAYILLIPSYFLTVAKEDLVMRERDFMESSQEYIEFDSLRDTVKIINQRLAIMDREGEPLLYKEMITKLLLLKTNDVIVTFLSYTKQSDSLDVEIRGQARDRSSLVDFIQTLEQDEHVDVTQAPVSNYIAADDLPYVLQLNITLPDSINTNDNE